MIMECYVPNKTTDVPLSVTNNCMSNGLHRGKLFNVKNLRKSALPRITGIFRPFLSICKALSQK